MLLLLRSRNGIQIYVHKLKHVILFVDCREWRESGKWNKWQATHKNRHCLLRKALNFLLDEVIFDLNLVRNHKIICKSPRKERLIVQQMIYISFRQRLRNFCALTSTTACGPSRSLNIHINQNKTHPEIGWKNNNNYAHLHVVSHFVNQPLACSLLLCACKVVKILEIVICCCFNNNKLFPSSSVAADKWN